jgi:hypothetical protein
VIRPSSAAPPRYRCALALFVVAGLPGCWSTARHVDTGADLLDPPRFAAVSQPIAVDGFTWHRNPTAMHRGHVDRYGNVNAVSTLEPTAIDVSRFVTQSLRTAGFRDVSYQPDAPGAYRVRGAVEPMLRERSFGSFMWRWLGCMTLCVVPLYFHGDRFEGTVDYVISDASGRELLHERQPVVWQQRSTCAYGAGTPPREAVGAASGTLIAQALLRAIAQRASGSLAVSPAHSAPQPQPTPTIPPPRVFGVERARETP